MLDATNLVMYIRSVDNSTVLLPEVGNFSHAFKDLCESIAAPGFILSVEGYFLFEGVPASNLQKFVGDGGRSTIILVTVHANVVGKPGALGWCGYCCASFHAHILTAGGVCCYCIVVVCV